MKKYILFEASFAENKLPKIIKETIKQIQRQIELFEKTPKEAQTKAFNGLFLNWKKNEMLVQCLLNKGIEHVKINKEIEDPVEALRGTLTEAVKQAVIHGKSINEVIEGCSPGEVFINIPSEDVFTKKSSAELKSILSFIREDTFFSRFEEAMQLDIKTANRCSSIEAFVSQILLEEHLPMVITRNQSRLRAQKVVARNSFTGNNQIVGDIFNGRSAVANHHVALKYLLNQRKDRLISVKLAS